MKKYSIVFSANQDNLYALVCKSWETDESGNEINVVTYVKSELPLDIVLVEMNNFLVNGN